jgi:Tol biopolymer transport system component
MASGVALFEPDNPAQAAFPGKNGKIAFWHHFDIYTVNPRGTNVRLLSGAPGKDEYSPAWSPGGKRIAFVATLSRNRHRPANNDIYMMHADGSHQVRLTYSKRADVTPAWSPSGKRIIFSRLVGQKSDQNYDLFTVDRYGNTVKRLTDTPEQDERQPAWSPSGGKIAYSGRSGGIYVMDADGSGEQVLVTANDIHADEWSYGGLSGPDWSPDGEKIVFEYFDDDYYVDEEIWVINADGSGLDWRSRGHSPVFSPDGNKIVFGYSYRPIDTIGHLYIINADGSEGGTKVDTYHAGTPSWQPLP